MRALIHNKCSVYTPNSQHAQYCMPFRVQATSDVQHSDKPTATRCQRAVNNTESRNFSKMHVFTGRREASAMLASTLLLQLGGPAGASHASPATGSVRSCLSLANIQTDYDRYAPDYDDLDGGAASEALGFPELRQQLLQQASGDVLEVAVGTGLNLPLYNWSRINSLTGVDLSEGMLKGAASRVPSIPGTRAVGSSSSSIPSVVFSSSSSSSSSNSRDYAAAPAAVTAEPSTGVPVAFLQADVSQLPFPDNSFDVVLDTFSLCVFADPAAALAEMARVLKPGGQLLLLEHSRSDNLLLGAYQGATRSLVAPLSKGCDWGQDVPGLVGALPSMMISTQQRHLAGTLVSITGLKQG